MEFLKAFIPMLIMVIIILLVYNALKIFVFDNIKVNKWVILVIAAVIFAVPNIIWSGKIVGVWQYLHMGVFLIFFLWFMDLIGLYGKGAKKKPKVETRNGVIKAKAKPNRIKDGSMEVISAKSKTRKKK
ncbi:hypothetical protein CLHOM_04260 [Clostridium homopropionicum DSM 5847]|uniref:Uncharacterized protein n=1 Tax=Clostridium homopropionicum DSM 5847 TaxID=1121318 RepID=A0A0L6ZE98_9CLOT|nr:hypothetical protein [Clostridium homopropionicum]KOA21296.1 hypothetical protein CLHOM_04260 [Clostridium homopropionicum DSM 5847]SFG30281.1 hypothetical protein SAMN04488501_107172 [Clostridium homopropionicum]